MNGLCVLLSCVTTKSDGERDPRTPVMYPNFGVRRLLSRVGGLFRSFGDEVPILKYR